MNIKSDEPQASSRSIAVPPVSFQLCCCTVFSFTVVLDLFFSFASIAVFRLDVLVMPLAFLPLSLHILFLFGRPHFV